MKLGKRLEKVLSLVKRNSNVVVDVGCDHGKLSYALIKEKNANQVYATDISAPSLEKAKELAVKYNLTDRIACVCCDGLNGFNSGFKADYVIIAGMGGNETVKILKEGKEKNISVKTYILQPMQDAEILRRYLFDSGYKIKADEIVLDKNKFYSIIKCAGKTGRAQKYNDQQLYFGKNSLKNKDFCDYLDYTKNTLEKRINFLSIEENNKLKLTLKLLNKIKR